MEGSSCQGTRWPLEAESGPWLIASKQRGPGSYICQDLDPANKENECGSQFFPTGSGKNPAWSITSSINAESPTGLPDL